MHLITWVPAHGRTKRGCPFITTYINTLMWNTGLENDRYLESCMRDRVLWSQFSSRRLLYKVQ